MQMWAHSIYPTRYSSRSSAAVSCVTHQLICTALRSPVALPTWTAHRGCSVRVYGLDHELLIVQRIGTCQRKDGARIWTVVSGVNNGSRYLKNLKSTAIIWHLPQDLKKRTCDGRWNTGLVFIQFVPRSSTYCQNDEAIFKLSWLCTCIVILDMEEGIPHEPSKPTSVKIQILDSWEGQKNAALHKEASISAGSAVQRQSGLVVYPLVI